MDVFWQAAGHLGQDRGDASWEGSGLLDTEAGVHGAPTEDFRAAGVRDAIRSDQSGWLATAPEDPARPCGAPVVN
jgi:hypothetical protein